MATKPDENIAVLGVKLKQLLITCGRTGSVLESTKDIAINRQIESLKALSQDVEKSRREVQLLKITNEEPEAEITTWNAEVEEKLSMADDDIKRLEKWQDEYKQKKDSMAREEQFNFEIKLHETKLQLQSEQNTKSSGDQAISVKEDVAVKLPKLVITKFDGLFTDWNRFWGQFSESIEKSGIASVVKFSYLKGLLGDKVRRDVESLPFTAEGYNRAKAILCEKYGKESEIVKAYSMKILELSVVTSNNPKKISEFSEKLTYCVQSLQTMKKLDGVNGLTSLTLDKLPAIRGDLVRSDSGWESWDLENLAEALRLWVRRNPVDASRDRDEEQEKRRREAKLFHSRVGRGCVYCDSSDHKANDCQKIITVTDRKQILAKKHLCFNCALGSHQAAKCQSKNSCQKCGRRHHTSICDKPATSEERKIALTANEVGEGVFPAVLVKVDGITTRALIDSGSSSSYVSAEVANMMNKKPSECTTRLVEMLMGTHTTKLELYDAQLSSIDGEFKMDAKLTKVNKAQLLTIPNPQYQRMVATYSHLQPVTIADKDTKDQLPIHVILSVGDYAKIKTNAKPLIGKTGEPIAELTRFGWFIMSPGNEFDRRTMLLTQTSQVDYEQLCRLDVLGLEDSSERDQMMVHSEFKEQLQRSPEGWYETGLPWRSNHPVLSSNKSGSLHRLNGLTKKLQRDGLTEQYDNVIREQLEAGIVERATNMPVNKEFYIPHKCVIKEKSETTKLRIVYDASARETPDSPSLNECLHSGPSLQNKLWDVLVQQRAFPVMVSADIRQAFLQIRVRENDRDALRFHWRRNERDVVETLRFARVLFGLAPSPYLLEGVLESHLDAWADRYPDEVASLRRSMYVDDLLSGGRTVQEAQTRKEAAREILNDATFDLHKWNSNIPQLEDEVSREDRQDQSYAKQQLMVKPTESKLLGLKWDKRKDTLAVTFPDDELQKTKRGVLSKLAKVYDPLGLVSPVTLEGKRIYRDVCDAKKSWDASLDGKLLERWLKWERSLPLEETVPRSIVNHQEEVTQIELHTFGDASTQGVGAAVYAVVRQPSGTTQRLITAKSRLAKRSLTVPRLELVGAHMATNLAVNVRNALPKNPVPSIHAWIDSMVALHWVCGNGMYKQFVGNCVAKIQAHPEIHWRYVPTSDNPADIASRGGTVSSSELWWTGPEWLQDPARWPDNPVLQSSPEVEAEAKVIREVLCVSKSEPATDEFDDILGRNDLRRTLRICAWINRFIHNCRHRHKRVGPLATEDVEAAKEWWIKRVQLRDSLQTHYPQTSARLGLERTDRGIVICKGRIQGSYPIYLPRDAIFTKKLIQRLHCETLHGRVGITMATVRECYWVPQLRSLVKRVRSDCWGCKRFRVSAATTPVPGILPTDRTNPGTAFEVVGIDFAGPVKYKKTAKTEGKAYLAIFACSLTKAIHLELLQNLETPTFLVSLKKYIARRGRPRVIYSDNGGTFVKASTWLKQIRKDERIRGLVEKYEITWKFNLSRAPWWGGQFERLIAVVKLAMYKVIGGGFLTWDELAELMLDIEIQINRRPLSYMEDDVELPTLTPSTFLYQRSNHLPIEEPWRIESHELRKRAKYLLACKNNLWKRWKREYLTVLRERHSMIHGKTKFCPKTGDVVIVLSDNKNRGAWLLAVIEETFPGKDGVVRAVRLKTKNGTLGRPVQHLYPMELSCDQVSKKPTKLNATAPKFEPRPRRAAGEAARIRIQEMAEEGDI